MPKRETVLLIHGTFAAPKEGRLQWWQPGSAFCRQIDGRLAELGSTARCWAHTDRSVFHWTGANNWTARSQGATELAAELRRLTNDGWRCHVVAHSHGGVVLLEALESLNINYFGVEGWESGSLVTMGTPFLATYRPAQLNRDHSVGRELFGSLLAIGIVVWFARDMLLPLQLLPPSGLAWLLFVLCLVVLSFLGFGLAYAFALGRGTAKYTPEHGRLLVMSSLHDEAFQLLFKVTQFEDPFRPERVREGRRQRSFRSWAVGALETCRRVDRLRFPPPDLQLEWFVIAVVALFFLLSVATRFLPQPVPEPIRIYTPLIITILVILAVLSFDSVVAVLCIPARATGAVWNLLVSGVGEISAWIFRRLAWRSLKNLLLGLQGYPFQSGLSQKPLLITDVFYECEQIPMKQRIALLNADEIVFRAHSKS